MADLTLLQSIENVARSMTPWEIGDSRLLFWTSIIGWGFVVFGVLPQLVGWLAAQAYRLLGGKDHYP